MVSNKHFPEWRSDFAGRVRPTASKLLAASVAAARLLPGRARWQPAESARVTT
jgi:hypothetical protein